MHQKGLSCSKTYFEINGPFRLNLRFALELAWDAFQTRPALLQTREAQTYFPFHLCAVAQRLSPHLLTRRMRFCDRSLTDVWLQDSGEQGCRNVTTLRAGPSRAASLEVKFCRIQNKNSFRSHCSVSGKFQGPPHSCEIPVASTEWMGILLVLRPVAWVTDPSSSAFCSGGGCLFPDHVCSLSASQPFPFTGGYRCTRHTKGRPASTWQIENFFKPRSFKCKLDLVLASFSFQQE